jgi:hypothetical protein
MKKVICIVAMLKTDSAKMASPQNMDHIVSILAD